MEEDRTSRREDARGRLGDVILVGGGRRQRCVTYDSRLRVAEIESSACSPESRVNLILRRYSSNIEYLGRALIIYKLDVSTAATVQLDCVGAVSMLSAPLSMVVPRKRRTSGSFAGLSAVDLIFLNLVQSHKIHVQESLVLLICRLHCVLWRYVHLESYSIIDRVWGI